MTIEAPRVAVLLSTFNGARHLQAQLDSFESQTEAGWHLFWRDDGSSDDTVAILERFAARRPCTRVTVPGRLGAAGSFYTLLDAAAPLGVPVAFSDQDDVWLPDKLARALAALAATPGPALYCSRQWLVDEDLQRIGISPAFERRPSFPGALTQNIATGCTVVLDPAAASLVAASEPPVGPLHDWWSYILVTGSGGRVVADAEPGILYRQHAANQVGAPRTRRLRALAALRRGPDAYLALLRANLAALRAAPSLTPAARRLTLRLDRALEAGPLARSLALCTPGLHRQTALETAVFRLWFVLGGRERSLPRAKAIS